MQFTLLSALLGGRDGVEHATSRWTRSAWWKKRLKVGHPRILSRETKQNNVDALTER
jgi:hypothetical protein